ncbi:MAG: STAS domain-containing protein [Solirubrobacteraceae bacterium]
MAGLGERPGEATIETTISGTGEATVKLSGEVDSGNVAALAAAVNGLAADEVHTVVFDVAGLSFIDSAGLAVLVRTASRVEAARVVGASPIVRRTIETTGLADALGLQQ